MASGAEGRPGRSRKPPAALPETRPATRPETPRPETPPQNPPNGPLAKAPDDWPDNVIVFDGVCNLCHAAVRFVLRFEAGPRYQFAALQGEAGNALMLRHGLNPQAAASFLLIRNGQAYTRSDAALELCRDLPRWRWLRGFRWLPVNLRDAVYNVVARHRYRLFGRKDRCQLVANSDSAEIRARFLI